MWLCKIIVVPLASVKLYYEKLYIMTIVADLLAYIFMQFSDLISLSIKCDLVWVNLESFPHQTCPPLLPVAENQVHRLGV